MTQELEALHPVELEKPIEVTNQEIRKMQATKRNGMSSLMWKLSRYIEISNNKQKHLKETIKSMQKIIEQSGSERQELRQ